MKRTYETELEKGRSLVHGVYNDKDIKERIKPVYTEERLERGIELHQKAKEAFSVRYKEFNESVLAHQRFAELKELLHIELMKLRKFGRQLFKNEPFSYKQLMLDKNVPGSYQKWRIFIEDTLRELVNNLHLANKYKLVGISVDEIRQMLNELVQLDELKASSEKEIGDSHEANASSVKAFKEFIHYCSDLRECLNLFFDDKERHKLEKMDCIAK